MQRMNVDAAGQAVKQFLLSLPIDQGDVELELNGKVLCKITGPDRLSDGEKAALRKKGLELIQQSHARNESLPASVIAREVEQAVQRVRDRR